MQLSSLDKKQSWHNWFQTQPEHEIVNEALPTDDRIDRFAAACAVSDRNT
jgi:hypothetical protein